MFSQNKVSPFRIDIIYQGVSIGTPTTILSVSDTIKLDSIGQLQFTMPSYDDLNQYLITGTYFNIYDEVDGFIGSYLFKSKHISDNAGIAITTVDCYDVLKELTFETVGFNRLYETTPVSDVIEDIVSLYPGWTTEIESDLDVTTIDYQGESILRAVDEQRDRNIAHYRLGDISRQLQFGYFGDLSEVVFTQLRGQVIPEYENNPNIAIITQISLVNESDEIYNKIIPLGFGQGVSQLTIERSTLGDYDLETGVNSDGSFYYYIEDTPSITSYGRRTRILSLPQIRALDNNEQNIINAANALKLTAEAYISKHLVPSTEYNLSVQGLRNTLKVGQLVKVEYKGITNNFKYIDVNDYFYVMDITRNRNANGNRNFNITISSVDVRRTSDQDVMIEVIRDLRTLNIRIPATLAYSIFGAYTRRIRGSVTEGNRVSPMFTVRLKEEVLYLNRAILRIATSPLKSSVTTTASNVSQTSSSDGAHRHRMGVYSGSSVVINGAAANVYAFALDGGGLGSDAFIIQRSGSSTTDIYTYDEATPHTHTIPSHNHNLTYDVFENDVFPQSLHILIDSIDYTVTLLAQIEESSFAPTNQAYEYEMDITQILINNGLKQNHTIEFYSDVASSGEIECEVNCLVTIQPIRID